MPIVVAACLAVGVKMGFHIAKSNDGFYAKNQKGTENLSCINDVFSLIDEEYVDTVNMKDLQVKAVTHVL